MTAVRGVVCGEAMTERHRESIGERWCFACRHRARFDYIVMVPVDRMSYWGPSPRIECTACGQVDGDCGFGRVREWDW